MFEKRKSTTGAIQNKRLIQPEWINKKGTHSLPRCYHFYKVDRGIMESYCSHNMIIITKDL